MGRPGRWFPSRCRHLAGITRAVGDLGLPTARVIANRHGQDISVVGSRAFLLKEMIEGSVQDPLPLEHMDQAGELLATLHSFPSPWAGTAVRLWSASWRPMVSSRVV